jgi:hypothetical protein
MDQSPLAGLGSCPSVTATCAQSPLNWLRMTSESGQKGIHRWHMAAGYCGESTVEAFLKRVGVDYPQPRVCEGINGRNRDFRFTP